MKLLIVEDHAAMRKTLRSVLESGATGQLEFIECDNGEDAITLFSNHHPDFVLMDIQLKQMDGFAASQEILRQNPDARIVFVSSFPSHSFKKKASEIKALGFVGKDNLTDLFQFIN